MQLTFQRYMIQIIVIYNSCLPILLPMLRTLLYWLLMQAHMASQSQADAVLQGN